MLILCKGENDMLRKMFFGLIMCLVASGCEIIYQPHSRQPLMSSVCTEPPSKVEDEKVWVEAKTNKIWVSPLVDENGDLIDGHYKYIVIKPGHWAVKGQENEQN